MISRLLTHQYKELSRSSLWQKSVAINIVIGFFVAFLLLYFFMVGYMANELIRKFYPGADPIYVFNSFLFVYFLADLLLRFFLQELPVLQIQPYLHLPVKISKILHFLQFKSVFTFFNLLPLFCLIPFAIKVIAPAYGGLASICWFMGIFMFILANGYLAIYVKRQFTSKPIISLTVAATLGLIALASYLGYFSLADFSAAVFNGFIQNPLYLVTALLYLAGTYFLNYQYLLAHTYPEELVLRKNQKVTLVGSFALLTQYGDIGELISYELRLIMRHKRTKSVAIFSVLFLLYGLIFYPNEAYMSMNGMLVFVGIFVTGGFMFNYGQFLISWEGNHFDVILAQNIEPEKYFLAKYYLFMGACSVYFIVTLPYMYFGLHLIFINFAALLFNIGINSIVILYFSTDNRKKVDLNKSSAFNYEGVGAAQFILMIPTLVLPVVLYLPFGLAGYPTAGIAFIGFIGLAGIILQKPLIKYLALRFVKRKYKIAAGFRQN